MMPSWSRMNWGALPTNWSCHEENNSFFLEARKHYQNCYETLSTKFESFKHSSFDTDILNDVEKIHSNFFEMACGLFLKETGEQIGLSFQKTPDGANLPDLLFSYSRGRLWGECVLPRRGDTSYSVPLRTDGGPHKIAANQSIARIINAIKGKKEQYQKRAGNTVSEEDFYLIIVCGDYLELPNLPMSGCAIDDIIRRLLTGSPFYRESNDRVSDSEFGIAWINYGVTHFPGATQPFTFSLYDKITSPDSLGVLYFPTAYPTDANLCYLWCRSSSQLVELGKKMGFKTTLLA